MIAFDGVVMNDITVNTDDTGRKILTVIVNGESVWTETVDASDSQALLEAYQALNELYFG